jgi:hypothetical protein
MRTFELLLPYAGRPARDPRVLPTFAAANAAAPRALQVAR